MKILVLNGSPKRDKSDTMHITRAFLDGMKEAAPQDIHIIHTVDQHIEYCTGCFSCMRNGGNMAMQKVGDRYEHVGQADFSHLRYLMICGCGFPNSRHNFEPAVMQFKLCFPGGHTIITVPESPMFNAPEAAVVTVPRLELIKQAGQQYAEKGEIETSLLAEITSPMIPEDQYAAIVNSGV